MSKIVCVGELLIDLIGDDTGDLKSNEKFVKRPGGAPANVAVAASRLGADVEKIATVGDDEFGDLLIEKLEEEGIETRNIERSELETTLAFASLDEDAKPHFSFHRGADEKIEAEQLDVELGEEDIVHFGSLPFTDERTAENLIAFARRTDATVSFDPNLREDLLDEGYRESLEEFVRHVDILVVESSELEFFDQDLDHLSELIITEGEDGAKLYSHEVHDVGAPEVDVVDTTGAGDALMGAYLAFRSEGKREALEKAVEAASLSIKSKGAMSALPTQNELG